MSAVSAVYPHAWIPDFFHTARTSSCAVVNDVFRNMPPLGYCPFAPSFTARWLCQRGTAAPSRPLRFDCFSPPLITPHVWAIPPPPKALIFGDGDYGHSFRLNHILADFRFGSPGLPLQAFLFLEAFGRRCFFCVPNLFFLPSFRLFLSTAPVPFERPGNPPNRPKHLPSEPLTGTFPDFLWRFGSPPVVQCRHRSNACVREVGYIGCTSPIWFQPIFFFPTPPFFRSPSAPITPDAAVNFWPWRVSPFVFLPKSRALWFCFCPFLHLNYRKFVFFLPRQ